MMENQIEILLVEDDSDDLELTMRSLGGDPFSTRIHVARDGEEALDFLFCRGPHTSRDRECRPKLVLLDLKLPKVDGLEVLKQIKADPRTKALPVVILTSSKQEQDLVESYRSGANSYVQKPVDFEQFRATLRQIGHYWMMLNEPPPELALLGGASFGGSHDAVGPRG